MCDIEIFEAAKLITMHVVERKFFSNSEANASELVVWWFMNKILNLSKYPSSLKG